MSINLNILLLKARLHIKALKNNKSTGFDNIAAETLKTGRPAMAHILLKITNTAFTQGKTPVQCSKGSITPVY